MNLNIRAPRSFAAGLAAVAASALGAGAARATIVTITDTVSIETLETAGGTNQTGTFDINSLVIPGLSEPYHIVSASMTAFGYSEINYAAPISTNYTGYNSTGLADYYIQSHNVVYADDIADQLTITAAGSSATGTASATYNLTTAYGNPSLTSVTTGNPNDYYSDQQHEVYSATYGEGDATTALGADALEALSLTGTIDYTLSAPVGQVTANSVELVVRYDNTPIPEPVSLTAFVAGIGGLCFANLRRRMKRKSSG